MLKLYISLFIINLKAIKLLNLNHDTHNLYTKFTKILEICKQFSHNLINKPATLMCSYKKS